MVYAYAQENTVLYTQQIPGTVTLDGRLEVSNESEAFVKNYLTQAITNKLTNSMTVSITPYGDMIIHSDNRTPNNNADDIFIVLARTEMSIQNGYSFKDNAIFAPNGTQIFPVSSDVPSNVEMPRVQNTNTDDYDATSDAE